MKRVDVVRMATVVMFLFVSPTRLCIDQWKRKLSDDADRGSLTLRWNLFWLCWSAAVCVIVMVVDIDVIRELAWSVVIFVGVIPWWRCNEITIAFLKDSLDQIGDGTADNRGSAHTNLSRKQRIQLALRSYVELVLDFGLIHFGLACLAPSLRPEWFIEAAYGGVSIAGIGDALYFSAITIATVGYGDIVPLTTPARWLVVYEIGAGLVLLYVSLVVYLSPPPRRTASA